MSKATPRKGAKKSAQKSPRRFRVMPMTMVMLFLLFVLKLSDVYSNVHQLVSVREAQAADEAAPADAPKPADAAAKPEEKTADAKPTGNAAADVKPAEAKPEEAKAADAAAKPEEAKADAAKDEKKDEKAEAGKDGKPPAPEMTQGAGKTPVKDIEALKAKENAEPYTQNELDLLQNLTKRRQELDQREQDIELKGKVLEATEKRINDKVTEMKTLQVELGKVVAEYNKQEDKQLESLVKIYENMKPTDAANIFNQMDMPILLEVIGRMSERKVAPVLAGMDPKRARDVTQELAEMRRAHSASAQQASAETVPPKQP